jgi:hypothetical protein
MTPEESISSNKINNQQQLDVPLRVQDRQQQTLSSAVLSKEFISRQAL